MYYVYVIQSIKTKEFYKGLTYNINNRLNQHFSGNVNFTKNKLPLRLVHVELCRDRKQARTIEKYFKSGYGREIIKEIAN